MLRPTHLLLFSTLAFSAANGMEKPSSRRITQISLERTECYGTCPAYKVTIRSDGTVFYHGAKFVERMGDYKAMIWPGSLDRLAPVLERLGYWQMKSGYSTEATDQPSQTVVVVSDRGTKTVHEYGHRGPDELWAVQTLIDGLLADARDWKRVGKK